MRVSLICFCPEDGAPDTLESRWSMADAVDEIHTDLTAQRSASAGIDMTKPLGGSRADMRASAFMGDTKGGPFDVSGECGTPSGLRLPANPNGRPNADVLKPWANGHGHHAAAQQASGSSTSAGN